MNENSPHIYIKSLANTDHPFGNKLGKEVFRKMADYVDRRRDQKSFCISLKDIVATDSSFPRESVVALAKLYKEDRGFYLRDFCSDDLIDNWHYAAQAKGQPLVIWNGKNFKFIGPELSPSNKKIIDFIYANNSVTASQISNELKMSVQNASTKLKNLYTQGYILRNEEAAESGGKEYIYLAINNSD